METDPLLTTAQAAELLGVSKRWLENRRRSGDQPIFVRLSDNTIRYRRVDLDEWIATLATGDHGEVATEGGD